MLLSKKTKESIRNDFNMIIEEYGFWEMCTDKDKYWVVKELFGHIIQELEPFLYGCEKTFIAEFIVSFAYRSLHAGEIL